MPGIIPVVHPVNCPPAAAPLSSDGCDRPSAVKVCNTTELADAIADAIEASAPVTAPGATEATLLALFNEIQRPRYDVEFSMCGDGVDDYMIVVDKNELVAGIPTVTYTNMSTNISSVVRPVGLKCASMQAEPCIPLAPVGVLSTWG